MSEERPVEALGVVLLDLMQFLEEEKIPGVVIGGVAASLHGRPRMTRDVDAVILADDRGREELLVALHQHGFVTRIEDPLAFARKTRVLLLRHDSTGVDVDISLGALPFESQVIGRAETKVLGGVRVAVASAEDIVVMKALARRPRDIADIESILDANPALDLDRVRHWLREFSSVLEMPEIHDEFESLLQRRKS